MQGCKLGKVEFLVVLDECKDALSVIFVPMGYRPGPCRGYRWGGPFTTLRKAFAAVGRQDEELMRQLYPRLFVRAPGATDDTLA